MAMTMESVDRRQGTMSSHSAAGHSIRPVRIGGTCSVWSILMVPFLGVSSVVGGRVGFAILSSHGLEGSEPMAGQGTPGRVAFTLSTIIFMTPMVVGLVLGARARRLGDRLGSIEMVVDGVILAGYVAIAVSNVSS
jgi:hypothetical protein